MSERLQIIKNFSHPSSTILPEAALATEAAFKQGHDHIVKSICPSLNNNRCWNKRHGIPVCPDCKGRIFGIENMKRLLSINFQTVEVGKDHSEGDVKGPGGELLLNYVSTSLRVPYVGATSLVYGYLPSLNLAVNLLLTDMFGDESIFSSNPRSNKQISDSLDHIIAQTQHGRPLIAEKPNTSSLDISHEKDVLNNLNRNTNFGSLREGSRQSFHNFARRITERNK